MTKILTILSTILLAVSISSAQTVWVDDPAHSQVSFSVAHLVIAEVTGRFKEFTVTLQQTAKNDFAGSILEASIKTASVDTENEGRDKHLRSDDFFNAEKFPEITFKSTAIEKTGTDTYKVSGDLTIRDITKPVVFEARYTGQVKDPWGNQKIGFKATASVNRFDYGLKWDKAIETGGLVAGDVVNITLLMEMAQRK
ncbi:MAG: YceI family protein [Bacteroidetes bacterium]|nr:YceI family protein [Bacteroidota bacterium]